MAMRTYGQFCGLAAAMDLVGQRWAMLLIRDLTPGPRRFTELFEGLPGIATDMLADRLRSLETAGIVRLVSIRHPAPAKVYELTESGRELSRIAAQLAVWGERLLPAPAEADARFHPRWALQSMTTAYTGGLADGDYALVVDDEQLTVEVTGKTAAVRYGPALDPIVTIRCGAAEFFALASSPSSIRRSRPESTIEGSVNIARAWFRSMPLRLGRTSA